jgi:hypothetical protein
MIKENERGSQPSLLSQRLLAARGRTQRHSGWLCHIVIDRQGPYNCSTRIQNKCVFAIRSLADLDPCVQLWLAKTTIEPDDKVARCVIETLHAE